MEQKYKRQYRQLSDETKQKIRNSSRNKPKSSSHIEHIRQGMLRYWEGVGDRPQPSTGATTTPESNGGVE